MLLASLENGSRHGYAVKEALRTSSGARFDLPTGTIYPALRRLQDRAHCGGEVPPGHPVSGQPPSPCGGEFIGPAAAPARL